MKIISSHRLTHRVIKATKGFFSIEYPELWIPLVLCFTCLLCLFTGRVLYVVTGKLRQKWTGRDTDKPQPLPVRWGNGKWKQVTDTAVGLCMSSFIITGLLSMSPIPKWLGDTHTAAEQDRLHPPLLLDNFSMEPYLLLQPDAYGTSANDGEKICMLKLCSYLNKPLVEIIRQKGNNAVQSEYIYVRITFRNVLLSHAPTSCIRCKNYTGRKYRCYAYRS